MDINHVGIGGSEEAISYLAQEFFNIGFKVTIYTSLNGDNCTYNGVNFRPHEDFDPQKRTDVFISFKDREIWSQQIQAHTKIHFSLEVEPFWMHPDIDHYVFTSNFHRSRMPWIPRDLTHVIPLGVSIPELEPLKNYEKDAKSILYASSPDRGLEQLLEDWPILHQRGYTLRVAYGFKILEKMAETNPNVKAHLDKLKEQLKQPGIENLGALCQSEINEEYARAHYWILPLRNPESELFCLNAVKSRYYGCKAIVNKVGALKETVGDYIDYSDFVAGDLSEIPERQRFDAMDWEDVVAQYWMRIL